MKDGPTTSDADVPASAPVLNVTGLDHVYPDGTRALKGVDFQLAPGERIALVGPNGSGKTTLLHHLNGLASPTRGEVRVDGTVVSDRTAAEVRSRVGLLFQDADDQLFMPTLAEDVAFGPMNRGDDPKVARDRAVEMLEGLGLEGDIDRPPHVLSGGQKRLAALAGLLVLKPLILALDEPTSGLDPRARRILMRHLNTLDQALIVASHDLEFCLELCPETLVLDRGEIVARGETARVFADRDLMEAHGLERPHSLDHAEGVHGHS